MEASTSQAYRPDIDGLRAAALLLVVAYHVRTRFTPGGFIGVDVFFVISGFLITSILMRELDGSRFSIQAFYVRRIRRICHLWYGLRHVVLECKFSAGNRVRMQTDDHASP